MYDRFAKEYNQWNEDGTPPVSCDGDITYFLKLQQERLKEKGLCMKNRVIPGKGNTYILLYGGKRAGFPSAA